MTAPKKEHAIMIVDWYRASCLCGWESQPKQSRGAAATSGAMHRSHAHRKEDKAPPDGARGSE